MCIMRNKSTTLTPKNSVRCNRHNPWSAMCTGMVPPTPPKPFHPLSASAETWLELTRVKTCGHQGALLCTGTPMRHDTPFVALKISRGITTMWVTAHRIPFLFPQFSPHQGGGFECVSLECCIVFVCASRRCIKPGPSSRFIQSSSSIDGRYYCDCAASGSCHLHSGPNKFKTFSKTFKTEARKQIEELNTKSTRVQNHWKMSSKNTFLCISLLPHNVTTFACLLHVFWVSLIITFFVTQFSALSLDSMWALSFAVIQGLILVLWSTSLINH